MIGSRNEQIDHVEVNGMAELKTTQTDASVDAYIEAIGDETRREDCRALVKLMSKATKAEPKMWGTSIVGFGKYHYSMPAATKAICASPALRHASQLFRSILRVALVTSSRPLWPVSGNTRWARDVSM